MKTALRTTAALAAAALLTGCSAPGGNVHELPADPPAAEQPSNPPDTTVDGTADPADAASEVTDDTSPQLAELAPPGGDPGAPPAQDFVQARGHAEFTVTIENRDPIRWSTQQEGAHPATCVAGEYPDGDTGMSAQVVMAQEGTDPRTPRADLFMSQNSVGDQVFQVTAYLDTGDPQVPTRSTGLTVSAGDTTGGAVDDLTLWADGSGATFDVEIDDPELGQVQATGFVTCTPD